MINQLLLSLAIASTFNPKTGPELVKALADTKLTPDADVIQLLSGVTYLVPANNPYNTALNLDNVSQVSILGHRSNPPTIKLTPNSHYKQGHPLVLFASGRNGPSSYITLADLTLDGSDKESTGEDTQQSSLFRAYSIHHLLIDNVTFKNIAADGIKLLGTAKHGRTYNVIIRFSRFESTGRAGIVLQSLIDNVLLYRIITDETNRKAGIDGENTNGVGSSHIQLASSYIAAKPNAAYSLQLGGADTSTGAMTNIEVSNTTVMGNAWVRNAEVRFTNTSISGTLTFNKLVTGYFLTGLIAGQTTLTHHGTDSPHDFTFSNTIFNAGVKLLSTYSITFDNTTHNAPIVVDNENPSIPVHSLLYYGSSAPTVTYSKRSPAERPNAPLTPFTFYPQP